MPSRREQVLAATLGVLAEAGGHGLTHRAVDRFADLPAGTASNHFRSREALFGAALEQLAAAEAAAPIGFDAEAATPADRAALARTLAGMVAFLLGPGRALAVARHALSLEAAVRPSLRPGLLAAGGTWWASVATALVALGCDRADERARLLLAYVDGVLADQLARPQRGFDPHAAIELGLAGLVPVVAVAA